MSPLSTLRGLASIIVFFAHGKHADLMIGDRPFVENRLIMS
jgi:hypothetical protein